MVIFTPGQKEHTMSQEEYMAAGQFKAQCLRLMDQVAQTHRELVITKHGKPVAKLVPYTATPPVIYGKLKHSAVLHGDILAPLDEVWEAEQ